jgi:hypoxanthine phosphoribosyltransferase
VRGGINADYIGPSVNPNIRADKVAKAVTALADVKFDAVAARGMSGAIIGGIIAHELKKPMFVVRKNKYTEETHHSCLPVEGPVNWSPPATYVIVDDFVGSGNTVRRIQEAIGAQGTLVGAYLYQRDGFTPVAEFDPRWLLNWEWENPVEEVPTPKKPDWKPILDIGRVMLQRWRGQRLGVLFDDSPMFAGDYYTTAPASILPEVRSTL